MKYVYTLILAIFLASCTATQTPVENDAENKTNTEMNSEIENLENVDMDSDNEESLNKNTPTPNEDGTVEEIPAVDLTPEEDTTISEMNSELEKLEMDSDDEEMESNVVKLDATYENPETEVDMVIEYTLDDENKIETINVSATTYDVSAYNEAVQVVVGKTLEEASEASIAGGSLTNYAFKNAIKQ